MRKHLTETTVKLWLSARDTEDWATRPDASWPCSALRGKRLFAKFDSGGLVDVTVDGRDGAADCPADEFNAITSDYLRHVLPADHPAYSVAVGQFDAPNNP